MKIGIDFHSAEREGSGNCVYIRNVVEELIKSGGANEYFFYVIDLDHPYYSKFKTLKNVNFRVTPFTNPLIRLAKIGIFTFQDKTDILLAQYTAPLFFHGQAVIIVHDLAYLNYPECFNIILKLYLRFFVPLSVKNSKRVITISEYSKNNMIKELKTEPDKIEVVHGAVDSLFKPAKDAVAIEKIKKAYNITDKYILSVGRLDPRKNILRLIEAFKIFKKNKSFTHKLVIVGKKDYLSSAIEKAIKEMPDQIIMAGYVPDESLAVLYSRAEAFVYPSLFEGFGLPVLEAMACGCPVISSNTSSIPEVSGGAALLIDPYKVEEIAAAINKVVLDDRLREEMRLKGLKRAEFFKWGFSAGKLLKVFERII